MSRMCRVALAEFPNIRVVLLLVRCSPSTRGFIHVSNEQVYVALLEDDHA
ncbi:MAG TPA: hypothetical protein VF876_02090 [Burkholderiales bacterium]